MSNITNLSFRLLTILHSLRMNHQLTKIITVFCIVEGDSSWNAFPVSFTSNGYEVHYVGELKNLIKARLYNTFLRAGQTWKGTSILFFKYLCLMMPHFSSKMHRYPRWKKIKKTRSELCNKFTREHNRLTERYHSNQRSQSPNIDPPCWKTLLICILLLLSGRK